MKRLRRWHWVRRFSPRPGSCIRWPSRRRLHKPMLRALMLLKSRNMRSWPARKFCTPSGSNPAPGVRHSRAYWIGFIAMADGPVLITGGAGFIGSHLVDALLAKGYAVRILDDLSTGKRSNLPLDNARVELIEG